MPGPSPGPSRAQARFLQIWKSGTWKSGNLGSKKIPKIRTLKIKIRVAQNVGKVWINGKKSSWPHLGQIFPWAGKMQKTSLSFCYFPWWANGLYSTALAQAQVVKCRARCHFFPISDFPLCQIHQGKDTQALDHYRDAVAWHGPVDRQIYGPARPRKSWHGKSWPGTARKILARKNNGTAWHGKIQ